MCHVIPLFFKLLGSALVLPPDWDDKQLKHSRPGLLANDDDVVFETVSVVALNHYRHTTPLPGTQDPPAPRRDERFFNYIR